MNIQSLFIRLFCLFAVFANLTGCGGADTCGSILTSNGVCSDDSSSTTPTITPFAQCNGDDGGLVDGCGVAITSSIDKYDPVIFNFPALTANSRYLITITDPLAAEISPVGGYLATSDESGDIHLATLVQNPHTALGQYTVTVANEVSAAVVSTRVYDVADRKRVICAADASGTLQASFTMADSVYAYVDQAGESIADGSYTVFVRRDAETPLAEGNDISGTSTTVAVSGGIGAVNLGSFSELGGYDVIVDLNANGTFERDEDLISRHARLQPCFTIQTLNSGNPMIQQISADHSGNRREMFDPDTTAVGVRDLFASITPTESSTVTTPGTADVYLVPHQDTWSDADPVAINDVRADVVASGPHNPTVRNGTNSSSNWLILPRNDMTGGCYDIIYDTNQDGDFDFGIDYVDNDDGLNTPDTIGTLGALACGLRVSEVGCNLVSITSHADGSVTTDTAITLEGTIADHATHGTPTGVYLTITSGTQTNTIKVTLSAGTFSLNVPLFSGDNHITMTAIYDDGLDGIGCSETITITSQTELALFRAQLTWDGSTDMDLHVVRPGGAYSNGGSGADDCNFANCSVGLDGAGSNSIDWGDPGEADDPKLDVDCIACGNGIENIWMNEINQNGDYKVYVDAFSGNENDSDVVVTIYIRGSAVAQVNCGNMEADAATDSCEVGTISWNGNSGTFAPSGALASDF